MKSMAISLFTMMVLTISACHAAVDTTFHAQGASLTNEVANLLVERGVCPSIPKKCTQQATGFYPVRGGLEFATVGIEDAALIQEIKNLVSATFRANPEMKKIKYEAYLRADPPLNTSFNGGGLMIDSMELRR